MESKNYNIDFDHPKRIKVLGCGHTFHNDCISNWFQFKGSNECPTDRRISATVSNIQLGGYKEKYLKYKQKYLKLKNNLN
jgi:hypothetical protein